MIKPLALALSKRQAKNADRAGGIELMIPWPEALAPPASLGRDEVRAASAEEEAWAREALGPALAEHDLTATRVLATCCEVNDRPGWRTAPYLAVSLVGRRWAEARPPGRRPAQYWIQPAQNGEALAPMDHAAFAAARRALGLSVAELAAVLGYADEQAVRRMEMPPARSTAREVPRLAALALRYMLRDRAEGRWCGAPELKPMTDVRCQMSVDG